MFMMLDAKGVFWFVHSPIAPLEKEFLSSLTTASLKKSPHLRNCFNFALRYPSH